MREQRQGDERADDVRESDGGSANPAQSAGDRAARRRRAAAGLASPEPAHDAVPADTRDATDRAADGGRDGDA